MRALDFPENASFKEVMDFVSGTTGLSFEDVLQCVLEKSNNEKDVIYKESGVTYTQALNRYYESSTYKNLALTSKISYDITLKQFTQYLNDALWRGVAECEKEIGDIKKYVIEDFLNSFTSGKKEGSSIAPRTLQRKLATLQAVYKYLLNEGIIMGKNPTKKIRLPKKSHIKPDYLIPDQVEKALDYSREGYFAERNFTILFFLLNTGARKEGVLRLDWEDIDFKSQAISLTEKGNKTRIVPLVPALADQLIYYQTVYKSIFSENPTGPVFVNIKGKYRGTRLTEEALRSFMNTVFIRLGFNDCKLHRTRRTYALQCLQDGMSLPEIKELLGHENVATTIDYLRFNNEDLRRTMFEHFPFAVLAYEKAREMV
ncbi:MAG: hypothetical protein CVV25_14260 [Ignavibacteriae bacterium HGW-Ignavibacteriae-4]|jgi:site-specific recombinase XerD|nr:MAG: hypothetical protein CVV25_14260 [Ignavibacteriae bacterium HGW-Ignavibacteriae-4]